MNQAYGLTSFFSTESTPSSPHNREISLVCKMLIAILFMSFVMCDVALGTEIVQVDVGRFNDTKLTQIITSANQFNFPGDRIVEISSHFIGAPYAANTLIGSPQEKEELVINLTEFDCFTFLDVVEALRRSASADDFTAQLKNVRYRNGAVTYATRRHFFSDWITDDDALIGDVTVEVGQGSVQRVVKQLNLKSDGTQWLPAIAVEPRTIFYIPTGKIVAELLLALQPGDYVGIYSVHAGLDVSHTGLIVISEGKVMLRHASSRNGVERVVDDELIDYLQGKPGMVVYRVKP